MFNQCDTHSIYIYIVRFFWDSSTMPAMPFHHWSVDSSPKVETALFYHKPQLDLPGMRTGAYLNQDGSGRERVPEPGSPSTLISCCCVDSQWLKPSSLQVAHFSLKDSQAYWPSYFFLCISDLILKYVFSFLQLGWASGIAVAAVACSLVVAIAPWSAGGGCVHYPTGGVPRPGVAPDQLGLWAHWGSALTGTHLSTCSPDTNFDPSVAVWCCGM